MEMFNNFLFKENFLQDRNSLATNSWSCRSSLGLCPAGQTLVLVLQKK